MHGPAAPRAGEYPRRHEQLENSDRRTGDELPSQHLDGIIKGVGGSVFSRGCACGANPPPTITLTNSFCECFVNIVNVL